MNLTYGSKLTVGHILTECLQYSNDLNHNILHDLGAPLGPDPELNIQIIN